MAFSSSIKTTGGKKLEAVLKKAEQAKGRKKQI
jgi:hypothetical protein